MKRRLYIKKFSHLSIVVVAGLSVCSGLYLLTKSQAATPFITKEPDTGSITSPATVASDTSVNVKAIKFGPAYTPRAKFEPPDNQTYIGASTDEVAIDSWARLVHIPHMAIFNGFTAGNQNFDHIISTATAHPELTPLQSWNVIFTNSAITSGSSDAYLKSQALSAKGFGKPLFLRMDWEMDGDWSSNYDISGGVTSAQYIASWQHVVDIFRSNGVTNVAWVWCPNTGNSDPTKAKQMAWYPGDSYVDWMCIDNYPDYAPINYAVTATNLNAFADLAAAHNKPLMVGEWARGNADLPPDTGPVIDVLFDFAERYPKTVKALLYFEHEGNGHALSTHPVSAAEFIKRVANPRYVFTLVK